MKKESSGNKKKLGLIIAIAAVVLLAIVGVVLALVLGGGAGKEEKLESKLYWNIDGKTMLSEETAMSTRKPAEDGLYYIRYLVGGEIVEIPFADKKLVTQADRRELACLKFDADGIAIDVLDPEELYVRIQDKTIVQAVDGNKITTNTSIVLNGMQKVLELPEGVPVVNVSTRTGEEEIGEKIELKVFDQVLIYGTDEETITDIFMTDRYWESKIYWSTAARAYWDAGRKVSTRPLAEDGYWYIDLACEGEVKTYKVAMQDCIDVLDSKGPTDAATGVVFDEDGAIVNLFNAGIACRGTLAASSYDVTNLSEDGKTFTATRIMFGTEIGKTYTGTITENTQIYNMTATADTFGEPTELQMNDRLLVYQGADGSIHTIFVVNRMVDSPFYYNLNQAWSSVNGLTRTPNEDGYYVYELAVDGKVKTVRTKDKALATKMDGMNLRVFGLKLKGDVVVKVYDAVNVAGNWSFASNNFVQTTEGGILGTVSTSGAATNGIMAADCKVFDVSQCYKNFRGEKTTVREGDQILAYQNAVGEVTHIWVLNRYMKGTTIYWNMNRYYDNAKKETTRTPDENGYYVFNAIKAGTTKVVQLKTKDKEVASRFDRENSTTAAALKVSGDIIKAAYPAPAAIGGYYRLAGFWVHELNTNDTPGTHALIARTGAIGNIIMADDCKVMNFSQITKTATGESTSLKEGDYVWPIAGQDGKIHYLFIIEREVAGSKLAWRKTSLATIKDADGNVMKDKDGNNMLVADKDGYYVFTLWVDGKIGTYKTKDLKIANYVNGRATGFAVSVKGDIITGAYPISSQPDTRSASVSYYDYVKITDGVMHLKRNRVGQTDTGAEMTVPLASGYKAYNFDPASGDDWGKPVKLNKGDRVYAYQNNNGESYIFFVMYRCTLEGGNERYCDHCGKKVHWESLFAGYSPVAGCIPEVAHYYLPTDHAYTGLTLGNATQTTEGKGTEIVFDLNGKTLTRKGTLNETDGIKYAPGAALTAGYGNTLRIVDYSKNNTGKMVTEKDTVYNGAGSLLHVQQGSKLIIDEGLIDGSLGTATYTAANSGTISVGGELIVNGGTIKGRASSGNGSAIGSWGGTSITINGGTLIGNTMTESIAGATGFGGVIAANGNLTINGGTIKGGTALQGDNIYIVNANSEVAINGGTIDGGVQIAAAKSVTLSGKPQIAAGDNYGLKLAKGMLMDATGLKAGARVFVDTAGVFTTDFASAKAAKALIDNSALKAGAVGMKLKVEGKAIASVSDGKIRDWTDTTSLPELGMWRLTKDVTLASRVEVSSELYIDLNGHDITRTVAADATAGCQVFRITGKLTIDDTSKAGNGTVSTAYADGQAINDYSAVVHVTDAGEFVLEGGIIDGSNVDNTYTPASNGTISVGGKLTVNGGTIKGVKRGSGNGGAIGAWAGSEITVNGGKIYAGGSFLNDNGTQKVNGAAIATTGNLTVNGGEFIGPGANATAEQRARSGGLIYANGDSLNILGGSFKDGFGTGYGFNIYYERSYLGAADAEGKRPVIKGGGEVVIGGDAYINGGVTIRSGLADSPVKLTVKDTAVIDSTGAVSAVNIRLVNGALYLNENKKATTTTKKAGIADDANYDISLVYTCQNEPKGFTVGNLTKYEHTYGNDSICDDCGHDKSAFVKWTDATSLPTKAGNYRLMTDVTVTGRTTISNEVVIDLNGHDITRNVAEDALGAPQVFYINGKLTIRDTSSAADGTVSIVPANNLPINTYSAVLHVVENGELVLEGGIIDGSNVDNAYLAASNGTISVGGKLKITGGTVKGFKRGSSNGGAIGAWAGSDIQISGGKIYAGGSFLNDNDTQRVNGAAIATTGNLKITGGEVIGPGATSDPEKRARSGGLIYANGDSLEILGGSFYDGFGTGYGFNIYYERSYLGAAGADGKRPVVKGGGKVVVGGDAYINGGVTIRSSVATEPAKLTVKDTAVIDASGAVGTTNVRLYNAHLYLNNNKKATTKAPADENYDISLVYTCQNVPTGYSVGNITTYTHSYGNDSICDECGYDKDEVLNWTATDSLPTKGRYKLTADVTVNKETALTNDLYLDLNGFHIVRNVAASAITTPRVLVGSIYKLTITDTSAAQDGSISLNVENNAALNASGAILSTSEGGGELILEAGIIDGSNLDNTYVNANNGVIAVGGKLTVNGGTIKGFKRGSGSGGAIGGWAGSEIVVNGGEIYAGGSFLNGTTQKVNGAAIATTGSLTITGGEIIGPGATTDPEKRARSGGLIYANGDSLVISGGTFRDGFGTGYGFNIYYERNYRGAADPETGVRPTITGGGEVTISGDTFIKGGLTIRSSKADAPVKLTVKDGAMIDDTGAVGSQNIRLYNGELYINDSTTAATAAPANTNYDISLVYGCQNNVIKGFITGHAVKIEHNYNGDNVCDDCGFIDIQLVLGKTTTTLNVGADETLAVTTLTPATATLSWTSSNEAVATVDANGKVTAVAAGNATITVTATAGEYTKTATCTVTVNAVLPGGWILWDATADASFATTLPKSGKYRLTSNVDLSAVHEMSGELVLDLNGYTVTGAAAPVIRTFGNSLTIDDLSGKTGDQLGKITTNTLSGNINGVIYANSETGTVTINNGIIDGSNITTTYTAANAGTITVSKNLVVKGGKIIGWKSNGNGSAIGSWGGTSITIEGGEIVGGTVTQSGTNTATGHGGAIAANGNLTISGGKISGGSAVNGGDNIWINNAASVVTISGGEIDGGVVLNNFAATSTISGNVTIKQGTNYGLKIAAGKKIDMTGLTDGEIYIDAEGVFTTNFANTAAAETVKGLLKQGKTAATGEVLSVSGLAITSAVSAGPEPETPIEEQAWTEWTKNNELPKAGKYKLMTNVNLTAVSDLTGDLWLDLNGYTVTSTAAPVISTNGNNLLIDDLSGKTGDELGCIKTTATAINARAAVVYVSAGVNKPGSFVLNNGVLDGTTATNSQANLVSGTVTVGNATNAFPTFTMNGGVIKGQKSSNGTSGVGGGCIGLMNSTHFVMNGGKLIARTNTSNTDYIAATGSCINAGGVSGTNPTSTITINGGDLYPTLAMNHGGAIYTAGNLYMHGGTIHGGWSTNSGAICSNGGAEVVIDGGVIVGGKTNANPGNGSAIDKAKGTLTVGGNAIIGGGICIRQSAKLVLTGNAMVDARLGAEQKYDVRINGGSVYLDSASSTAISSTNGTYKVTYDANGKINGLAAYAATAVTEGTSIPTSGAVKLTAPVTLTQTVETTGDLYIDLNGQTVTNTASGPAIQAKHNVIITDSSAEKTGTIKTTTATFTSSASVILVDNGKKVILVDGTLDGSAVANGYTGSFAGAVTAGNFATFYMLGGEVKGQISSSTGSTGKGGSCIGGWNNSVIVINGGKLTAASKGTTFPTHAVAAQGTCIASGGNVFVHGGELYGTMATNHGGNIYTTGNLTITGGLISGGYSNNSGLISSSGASITITGGTLVGGTAHSAAGSLGGASIDYAKNGGVLTIGGNAKIAGGVSLRSSAKLVLTGKAVIDMNMAGQTQKLFNIRFKNGTCSIYLHDTTGTALASGGSGSYDVTYDAAGNITGITAK